MRQEPHSGGVLVRLGTPRIAVVDAGSDPSPQTLVGTDGSLVQVRPTGHAPVQVGNQVRSLDEPARF